MKRGSNYLLLLGMLVFVISCQKNTNSGNKPVISSDKTTAHHGLGAILDKEKFKRLPHINFDAVRADLIRKGYGNKIVSGVRGAALPSSIILNHPSIGNQGQTGTCVSWSSGWALMGTLNNEFPVSGVYNPRSPWYVYQTDHSASGDCDPNDGMYITSGLNILQNNGVPAYSFDASLGSPCNPPSSAANSDAASDVITNYAALSSIADIKNALSMHLPVEMGFSVYQSFEDAFSNGAEYTSVYGSYLGGHAICIIGYDDSRNAVLIQNSWGTGGGDPSYPGCMWIDYSTVFDPNMQVELYSVWR